MRMVFLLSRTVQFFFPANIQLLLFWVDLECRIAWLGFFVPFTLKIEVGFPYYCCLSFISTVAQRNRNQDWVPSVFMLYLYCGHRHSERETWNSLPWAGGCFLQAELTCLGQFASYSSSCVCKYKPKCVQNKDCTILLDKEITITWRDICKRAILVGGKACCGIIRQRGWVNERWHKEKARVEGKNVQVHLPIMFLPSQPLPELSSHFAGQQLRSCVLGWRMD